MLLAKVVDAKLFFRVILSVGSFLCLSDAKPVVQYVDLFGWCVMRGTLIHLHPPNEQDESLVSKVVCEPCCLCKISVLPGNNILVFTLVQCYVKINLCRKTL